MLISDIISALKDLATLIGLPFFSVLLGFFILMVELFGLGVLMLFVVGRIRKEMINMNRKIDLLVPLLPEKEAEKEPEKGPEKEPQKESEEELEKESEKKKFRYKWK